MRKTEPTFPFDLDNQTAYRDWRARKLDGYPASAEALVVEVDNPLALNDAECAALLGVLRKTNMVLYAARTHVDDATLSLLLGEQFGLTHLDHNYLAENSGLSAITVSESGDKPQFIPYTAKALKWHTDGYYNSGSELIRAFVLHCVNDAAEGGDNALLDPEILYILLRDENPAYVRAMQQPDMMCIPARLDEEGIAREEASGPVFRLDPQSGALHTRYSARKRNIRWKEDALSKEALACLESLLAADLPYIFRAHLRPGMGLLCNNVLHERSAFHDDPAHGKRLLYRARFFDRIRGT